MQKPEQTTIKNGRTASNTGRFVQCFQYKQPQRVNDLTTAMAPHSGSFQKALSQYVMDSGIHEACMVQRKDLPEHPVATWSVCVCMCACACARVCGGGLGAAATVLQDSTSPSFRS